MTMISATIAERFEYPDGDSLEVGHVAIITTDATTDEEIEAILADYPYKFAPGWRRVTEDDLPVARGKFRAAWRDDGARIAVDPAKVKEPPTPRPTPTEAALIEELAVTKAAMQDLAIRLEKLEGARLPE